MKHIKLDATPSTNDFLKQLLLHEFQENFTVVTAKHQTNGKGQLGTKWETEIGKNLTMSVLYASKIHSNQTVFDINKVVCVSIIKVLKKFKIDDLCIKWPNDILAGNKKIGGILIENSFKSNEVVSVIGVGINVNQTNFEDLPNASSIFNVINKNIDLDFLAIQIVTELKNALPFLNDNKVINNKSYLNLLYKKNVPMPFEKSDGTRFMGIIQNVSENGFLEILNEDDETKQFEAKQIKMLY
jgi:BirA family transcriptional regulator, biotin operon repressor / biotin---[acetyl-CoA-carboxylase] ligase